MGVAEIIRNNLKNGASREYSEEGLLAIASEFDCLNAALHDSRVQRIAVFDKYLKMKTQLTAERAENERLRALLNEAFPFVGWGSAPEGLADRCYEAAQRKEDDDN